jgi:hypothetical protein
MHPSFPAKTVPELITYVLSSIIYVYGGWPLAQGLKEEITAQI